MLLPKKVKIAYRWYKVEELGAVDAQSLHGDTNSTKGVIRLFTEQEPQIVINTLLHEIIHAVLQEYGLERYDKEHLVCTLSNGLCQVLRDNPEVLKLLEFPDDVA